MEKNKPGFMVYKATVEAMQTLTGDQCKTLMLAIGEFAFQEAEPDFGDDQTLTSLWPLLRDGLLRDDKRYKTVNIGKQYSAYCGAAKRNGLVPMTREKWEEAGCPTYRETQEQMRANASNATQTQAAHANAGECSQMRAGAGNCAQCEPTTNTTATTPPPSSPIPSTTPSSSSAPPPPLTSDGAAAVAADVPAFAKVVKEIRNLIPQLSPLREETLEHYCSQVGADVCVRAIYEARDANVNGVAVWSYIESILKRCEASGIRSLADWNAAEEQRRVGKSEHQSGKPQSRQDRNRVPDAAEYEGEGTFHL